MFKNKTGPTALPGTFFLRLGATVTVWAAGWLWLVAGLWPYTAAKALGNIVYNDYGYFRLPLALTQGRWWMLRVVLFVALLLGAAILASRGSFNTLAELRLAGQRASRRVRRYPRPALGIVAVVLLAIVLARGWYLLQYPLSTDEVGSFDFFVAQGPLAISSYYPIPNNHIFYNLLAWPGFILQLPPFLVMRLPTLLLGIMGTGLSYLLLARATGLRLATLVTGLVALAPGWVYYAAAGRGYFLQLSLLQMGFFAVLELLRPVSRYQQLAWAVFVGSSIFGLYTIPTYAYPLVALGLSLAVGLRPQHRTRELVWAGLIIALISALLYAPVGVVSGWNRLVGNRYVTTRAAAQFWPSFRAVLYEMAAELFGPSLRLSGPAWLALAGLGGVAAHRLLPAGPRRQTALVAWALLATPLLLMAIQRVYMPTRALLYLALFGYLLVALLATLAWQYVTRTFPLAKRQWPLVVAAVLGLGSYRLWQNQAQLRYSRTEAHAFEQAYKWLSTHPRPAYGPARVWLHAPLQALFFAHYNQLAAGPRPLLTTQNTSWPAEDYDFIVLDNRHPKAATAPTPGYQRAYHDQFTTIYARR